jgi:hypothetical protein
MVIVINGIKRSGKDTFISMFSSVIDSRFHVINKSSIQVFNDIIFQFINKYDSEKNLINKTEKYRTFVSKLKELTIDYCDFPRLYIEDFILENDMDDCVIFLHIREPDEIKKIEEFCLSKKIIFESVFMINPNTSDGEIQSDNYQNISNYNYDTMIHNDGTIENLREKVVEFINKIVYRY